jgi:trafficking protein particle complex subunit 6
MTQRNQLVSATALDLLNLEFAAYLLRNHDDGRVAQEAMSGKLERVNFNIGRRFAERLCRERSERMSQESLDIVKFVCRELWTELFRKPVDKLQTNNKGTYVLQDYNFRPLRYLSTEAPSSPSIATETVSSSIGESGSSGGGGGGFVSNVPISTLTASALEDTKMQALRLIVAACGLVRGALDAFGITDAIVTADVSGLPRVVFTIKVPSMNSQSEQVGATLQ